MISYLLFERQMHLYSCRPVKIHIRIIIYNYTNIYIYIYYTNLSYHLLIYDTSPELGGVLDGYISVTFGEWCPQRGFPKISMFAKVTATSNSSLSYCNFNINKIQQVDSIYFYLSTFFCTSKTRVFGEKQLLRSMDKSP